MTPKRRPKGEKSRKTTPAAAAVVLPNDLEDGINDPELPDIEELRLQLDEGARWAVRDILTGRG